MKWYESIEALDWDEGLFYMDMTLRRTLIREYCEF
jgi:hypothetical protein